jgi:putative oxidoreductase
MRSLLAAGRALFTLIFITAAPRHFTGEGIHHAAQLGVPLAFILVPISGLMSAVGGLSVATGFKVRWGAWILFLFLLPVTGMMHAFWKLTDPVEIHIQQAMFAKNLSLLGAALILTQLGSDKRTQPDDSWLSEP